MHAELLMQVPTTAPPRLSKQNRRLDYRQIRSIDELLYNLSF